mmetsp:Transcript_17567/g.36391  ORF Transcript_17567/g.36391 Transcript_17567/m.36391 type:complete len:369 (-) Transcript_17567:2046-3152(-)
MWDLLENVVLLPHSLHDALGDLHGRDGGLQVVVRRDDVDHRLDDLHSTLDNEVAVLCQVGIHHFPLKVTLKEDQSLTVGIVPDDVLDVGQSPAEDLEGALFSLPHRNDTELTSGRNDLDNAPGLRLGGDGGGNEFDGGVGEVVVASDETKVQAGAISSLLVEFNHLGLLQIPEHRLHDVTEVLPKMLLRDSLQSVVNGILCQASVHEGPSQPVQSLLLVLNDLRAHLIGERVVQVPVDMGLYRKRLEEELTKRRLLWGETEDHCLGHPIDAWSSALSHHLQNVSNGIISVAPLLPVIGLGSKNGDEAGFNIQSPAQFLSGNENRNHTIPEQSLHPLSVRDVHAGVHESDSSSEGLPEGRLLHGAKNIL